MTINIGLKDKYNFSNIRKNSMNLIGSIKVEKSNKRRML